MLEYQNIGISEPKASIDNKKILSSNILFVFILISQQQKLKIIIIGY